MPAIALQQLEAADLVQQLVGVVIGQRRDAEVHVAQHFDVNAAEAEADERTEQRVFASTPIIVSTPPVIIGWISTPSTLGTPACARTARKMS